MNASQEQLRINPIFYSLVPTRLAMDRKYQHL